MASFPRRMCAPAATRVEDSKNTRVATPSALETAATAAAAAAAAAPRRGENDEPRFYDTPSLPIRRCRSMARFEQVPRYNPRGTRGEIDSSIVNPRTGENSVRSARSKGMLGML